MEKDIEYLEAQLERSKERSGKISKTDLLEERIEVLEKKLAIAETVLSLSNQSFERALTKLNTCKGRLVEFVEVTEDSGYTFLKVWVDIRFPGSPETERLLLEAHHYMRSRVKYRDASPGDVVEFRYHVRDDGSKRLTYFRPLKV